LQGCSLLGVTETPLAFYRAGFLIMEIFLIKSKFSFFQVFCDSKSTGKVLLV
jgi:hypothetical protein